MEKAREQADAQLHELARRRRALFLQIVAELLLNLLRLQLTAGDATEELVVAAEHPRVHLAGFRRQILKPLAPLRGLRHGSAQ